MTGGGPTAAGGVLAMTGAALAATLWIVPRHTAAHVIVSLAFLAWTALLVVFAYQLLKGRRRS